MRVARLSLRDFRSYATADVALGPALTVVTGRNGAGKTNLLEGLYFACAGRSCRTANERELVRFGAPAARAVATVVDDDEREHELAVGFQAGEPRRITVDGTPVERLSDHPQRPLVAVFLPDRLGLVKGTPALRRAHLDQVVAALWPTRAETRRAYSRALAQRNALLGRVRAGAPPSTLAAWDAELARHGIELMSDRAAACDLVAPWFARRAGELGLDGDCELVYRPRSQAGDAATLAAELAARADADAERGFTGHGPHRDELVLRQDGRELRAYGSQGQQRLGLLALLLAERAVLEAERARPPLLLLDDVMSELDGERRRLLVELILAGGQALLTTTEIAHVPRADDGRVRRLAVGGGAVLEEAAAA